jgi:general L-amino acid transport system permease protein
MLNDARYRAGAIQALFLLAAVGVIGGVAWSTAANLSARGVPVGWQFLFQPARFQIAETILPYASTDPNWWALVVGLANSLFVAAIVIVQSTILGLLVGIGRLSANPLVRGVCRVWVEIARNTPVVVLLIFTYALWWRVLPLVQEAWTLAPGVHLSVRGLALPALRWSGSTFELMAPVVAMLIIVCAASAAASRRQAMTGRRPRLAIVATSLCALGLVGLLVLSQGGFSIEWPTLRRANFFGGWQLTPELTTILVGLVVYTARFIGEIVRGGIQAIGKGQWEAAKSLGLTRGQTFRLVIIPLALRIIIPPLNSQYINVVKNSTLAIVVGYQDFMTVASTMINVTSHAIEGIALILGTFLVVNLTLSALMNAYNRRIALVER